MIFVGTDIVALAGLGGDAAGSGTGSAVIAGVVAGATAGACGGMAVGGSTVAIDCPTYAKHKVMAIRFGWPFFCAPS